MQICEIIIVFWYWVGGEIWGWRGGLGTRDTRAGKAARGTCGVCGHFFKIEDILVQISCTYVAFAELCGDLINF